MTPKNQIKTLLHSGELANIKLAIELINSQNIAFKLSIYLDLFDWLNQYESDSYRFDKKSDLPLIVEHLIQKESLQFYHNPFLKTISEHCSLLINLKKLCLHSCPNFRVEKHELTALAKTLEELEINDIQLKNTGLLHQTFNQLKIISLQNCQLQQLPEALLSTQSLESIDLSNNPIQFVGSNLPPTCSVRKLKLENCQIQQINSFIKQFPNSIEVDICHNQLAYIGEEFADLHQLKSLKASHNQLRILSPELACCTQLKSLDLSNNFFDTFPTVLNNLVDLKVLNLAANQLLQIKFEKQFLRNILSLNLSDNPLLMFPESLLNAKNLETLNLNGLDLRGQIEAISSLKSIKVLRLRKSLYHFSELLKADWTHLSTLDIRNKDIDADTIANLKAANTATNILH